MEVVGSGVARTGLGRFVVAVGVGVGFVVGGELMVLIGVSSGC